MQHGTTPHAGSQPPGGEPRVRYRLRMENGRPRGLLFEPTTQASPFEMSCERDQQKEPAQVWKGLAQILDANDGHKNVRSVSLTSLFSLRVGVSTRPTSEHNLPRAPLTCQALAAPNASISRCDLPSLVMSSPPRTLHPTTATRRLEIAALELSRLATPNASPCRVTSLPSPPRMCITASPPYHGHTSPPRYLEFSTSPFPNSALSDSQCGRLATPNVPFTHCDVSNVTGVLATPNVSFIHCKLDAQRDVLVAEILATPNVPFIHCNGDDVWVCGSPPRTLHPVA